jgi:hypothetical protein
MGGIDTSIYRMLQPPQVADPVQQYERAMQIKSIIGQQQLQQQQVQQNQQAMADQAAMTEAYKNWDGQDPHDLVKGVLDAGGSANAVNTMTTNILGMRQKASDIAKADAETGEKNLDTQTKLYDGYRGRLQAIIAAPADQKNQLWDSEITKEEQAGAIRPGTVSHQYPGDDQATVFANHYALGSVLAKEANDIAVAKIRASKPPEGELPLPNVDQMNQGLASRWQVLNPGKPLPPQFTLPPNATQKDFDRVDKMLTQTEQATGIKAQQDSANQMRQQTAQDRQDVRNSTPVFAFNPKTGQREQSSFGEYQSAGLTNPVKVTNSDIEKETQLNSQLNDLQLNTSRFKNALNAMGPLSQTDVANMTHILSDPNVSSGILNNIGMPAVISMLEQGSKARDWNALSPDKQQALIGALRMKNSALLFQKVATGMGRASKEAMDIEIANMPSPIEGATVGNQKLQAFQENIDQMASRSVKLPGMDQSKDVKSRVEAQGVAAYNAAHGTSSGAGSNQVPSGATPVKNIFGKVIGYDQNGKRVLFSSGQPASQGSTLQNLLAPTGSTPASGSNQ